MSLRILFLMQEPHQEPLGAGSLIAASRRAGYDARGRFFHTPVQAAQIAADVRPDIVAYSVMTGQHPLYLLVNSLIKKERKVFSIFGGPHPTYSPNFVREDGVDAVCRGEGEAALVNFLDCFHSGNYLNSDNFVFKTDDGIVRNTMSPLIDDLDSLAFTDRDFFYQSEPLRRSHLKSFMASRGCPYSCTYCFNHVHNELYKGLGPVVRRRSVDNVIQEVLDVKDKYPLGMIQFMDDTFVLSREWLEEFSEKFPARADIPFFCNVRAELVSPEVVRDLKRAGCTSVCLGIETGDEELRRRMLGRTQTNEQIIAACRLLHANGIKVMTTNMLGIPGGSLNSDMQTYRLNVKCRVDYAWASLTYPYPGTKIHSLAAEAGVRVPGEDALPHSYFYSMAFESPDKRRIENLHRLLAFASGLRLPEGAVKLLIGMGAGPLRPIYTLVFGFWKLYCYESRIFKRRGSWWLTSDDFLPRFINNISLGMRMMFSGGTNRMKWTEKTEKPGPVPSFVEGAE